MNDISAEIMKELEKYSNAVIQSVNECTEANAKNLQKELRSTSPKKTGNYAKGWRAEQVSKTSAQSTFIVHNKTKYQLTHLLEYGHAVNGGTERVKAYPHIEKAKEKAVEKFVREIEKAIEEAGK